jgi:hypothetical protein
MHAELIPLCSRIAEKTGRVMMTVGIEVCEEDMIRVTIWVEFRSP